MLSVTLRWFADGNPRDIQDEVGMSESSFHELCHEATDAINKAPQLASDLPTTERQQSITAEDFASVGTLETMNGCLDGNHSTCQVGKTSQCFVISQN